MYKLWRGIDAKLDYAQFHLEKTSEALVPPRLDAHMVPIAASGAIIGHEWPWHHHHRQDHDRHRRGPMVGRPAGRLAPRDGRSSWRRCAFSECRPFLMFFKSTPGRKGNLLIPSPPLFGFYR